MKIMITASGNKKSWYRNEVGNTFTVLDNPPEWTKEDLLSDVFYVEHPRNNYDTALFVKHEDCIEVLDVLPKCYDPAESPSVAAAEGGFS